MDADAWSRRRLLAVLAAVLGVAALLVATLVVTTVRALTADDPPAATTPRPGQVPEGSVDVTRGRAYQDRVAAARMQTTRPDDPLPGRPTTKKSDPLAVPEASRGGPAAVPSGYPHTPIGAVAQLAAIDQTAMAGMAMGQARRVHDAWTAPGAVRFGLWPVAANIAEFHQHAGTVDGDTSIAVSLEPMAGQVKGVDGPDWVLACVLYRVSADGTDRVEVAYGRCERMNWDKAGDRWLIGPGRPPAPAPSTWPGTHRAHTAGWQPLTGGEDR